MTNITPCSVNTTDVLIVGAGLAGLTVALSLPENFHITLLAKEDLSTCASNLAQGGVAAVIDQADSVAEHIKDTLIAGAGCCNEKQTAEILAEGNSAIEWLCAHGVEFTRENGRLHLTREGGHGRRRIVHAADHTGHSITHTLQQQLSARPNIHILPHSCVIDLVHENSVCTGAVVQMAQTDETVTIQAKHTVLATGGLGQLFTLTTNPVTANGQGVALAALAGCRTQNLAFVQFHPTALALPENPCFLISEAVRGEGGILRNQQGRRFMPEYDNRAELAPRDIVARAIASEIAKTGHHCVYLDITHLPESFIRAHFPQIHQHCLQQGLDITRELIPVAPAAHYACGGIVTDTDGRTDMAQLYAIGETACTGLHGANRLASNSLLECVVTGRNAAASIVASKEHPQTWPINQQMNSSELTWQEIIFPEQPHPIQDIPSFSMQALQHSMSRYFGICRRTDEMLTLLKILQYWYRQTINQQHKLSLVTALLMVQDGLNQQMNRGTHFNLDLQENL